MKQKRRSILKAKKYKLFLQEHTIHDKELELKNVADVQQHCSIWGCLKSFHDHCKNPKQQQNPSSHNFETQFSSPNGQKLHQNQNQDYWW